MPRMKPSRAEGHGREHEKQHHPERVCDFERHDQARRGENDQAEQRRLRRSRADVAEHDLEIRHRRRQDLVDRAGEPGKVNAERSVRDALHEQRKHDQPGHDERAVAHAVDFRDARADRRAEHHEVKRRRDHRRQHALQQRAPGACHLEQVDRPHAVDVHAGLFTRLTKISSSELWVVCRSLKPMLASLSSSSSAVMPVRSACVS